MAKYGSILFYGKKLENVIDYGKNIFYLRMIPLKKCIKEKDI
jgi:hypothetical protein